MLDPPAAITGIGAGQFIYGRQHFGIGGIANGVDRDLEFVERGAAHQIAQLFRGREGEAAVARIVGIRLFQPCTA